MTDMVPVNPQKVCSPAMLDLEHDQIMARATKIANVLQDVIKRQKLATEIQGKNYIRVEGWNTMGTMLGYMPREALVYEQPDGSFEATVEIFNPNTGVVVSRASALCGMDEKRWARADRFARRSMAVTRATGKAYRLGFSWVMSLAGYQVTPAEEMPEPVIDAVAFIASYDPGYQDHKLWLADALKRTNIAKSDWKAVSDLMVGKSEDDLPAAIEHFLNQASKI